MSSLLGTCPQRPLILDACCVINLYATDIFDDVIRAWAQPVAVAEYVRRYELKTFSLESEIERSIISEVSLGDEAEFASMIDFAAALLDDGEAATAALAIHREWDIATDDRAARRFLAAECPKIQLFSTPDLIAKWAEVNVYPDNLVRDVLERLMAGGRYTPPCDHPLTEWWHRKLRR